MDKLMIKISKLSGENLDKYLKTENIDKLYELKEILDDKYYNTSETLFTDDQYDMLKESLMKRDKKKEHDKMNYILLEKIGKGCIESISLSHLKQIILN